MTGKVGKGEDIKLAGNEVSQQASGEIVESGREGIGTIIRSNQCSGNRFLLPLIPHWFYGSIFY